MSGPYITKCDDGSTLIEWILSTRGRFCISIEPDPSESSWGYVDKDEGETGVLPSAFVRAVAPDLLRELKEARANIGIMIIDGIIEHYDFESMNAAIAKAEGD